MKLKALAFFSLFILISFFGTGLIFSLLSPPVYGQSATGWNIHRQGANDLNFYYGLSSPNGIALQLNINGNAQIRGLIDLDDISKTMDPSGTTNFNILNTVGNAKVGAITTATQLEVLGTGIPLFISRGTGSTSTVAATALLRQISTGDMTNGFGPSLRFDAQDNAGVTNVLALIGAVRDGADNSGAIIFNPALGGIPTERMRVSTAGDVGIGTTVPTAKLDVDGNITQSVTHGNNMKLLLSAARNIGGTGQVGLYSWISEPGMTWTGGGIARNMYNHTGFPRVNTGLSGQMLHFTESGNVEFTTETSAGVRNTPMTIGNNGSVGIGTTLPVPGSKLDVQIASNAHIGLMNWNNSPTLGGFTDSFGGWSNITIAPGGNVAIGASTAPSAKLQVIGDARIDGKLGINGYGPGGCNAGPPADTYGLCLGGSGYAGTSWVQGSDIRFKTDINPIKDALNKVLSLEGVTFKYDKTVPNGDKYPDTTQIGFIAQQVEPIVPEVVTTNYDGYKAMSYPNLTALLTEAIKEQQKQINNSEKEQFDQKQTIQNLEAQINLLRQEIQELKNK